MMARRISDAILIVESNLNERRVTDHLRTLILSFSNPMSAPMQSITEYLNQPDTQFSATRELFEEFQNEDEEDEEVDQDNLMVQDAREAALRDEENHDENEQEHENNWDVPEIPRQDVDNNTREERQRLYNSLLDFINGFP